MSDPASSQSPYQSRLFNFLNRQYININDQVGKKLRQLGLGMKWTVQTMLYPLYLLVQTARIMARKLQSTFNPNQLELDSLQHQPMPPLPDADQQINIVLKEIAKENNISSLPKINLQGIATNIENSHLVLVNSHNRITDVLSLPQQRNLHLLMRDLRADYWEKKRIITVQQRKLSKVFPVINPISKNKVIFWGLFWQLMAWIQKSSIAISLNLFGESQYLCSTEIKSSSYLNKTENTAKPNLNILISFLTNIDNQLANLEQVYLFKNEDLVVKNSSTINNLNLKQEHHHSLNENQKQSFSLQGLIKSAIDYFFGDSQNKIKLTEDKSEALVTNNDNYQQKHLSKTLKYKGQNSPLLSNNIQKLLNKLSNNIQNNLKQFLPKVNQLTNILTVKINNIAKFNQNNLINKLTVNNKFKQQKDPFQIQVLIWAAMDYFFHKKNKPLSSAQPKIFPNNFHSDNTNQLESSEELRIEENWLSWDDLYGHNLEKKLSNRLNETEKLTPKSNTKIQSLSNKPQDNPSTSQSLVLTSESDLKSIAKSQVAVNSWHHKQKKNQNRQNILKHPLSVSQNLSKTKNNAVNSVQSNSTENQKQIEVHQQLLETKAVNLGYEKHFLQTILEWMDKAILWIEELLIKIFRWFKRK